MTQPPRHLDDRFRQDRLQILDPATADGENAGHSKAVDLLAAWRCWQGLRTVPERDDVNPLDMPHLLSSLLLLDVEEADFRFRLVGETIATCYAIRLKGKTLGEVLSGDGLDETLYEHRRCADDRQAVLATHSDATAPPGDIRSYVRLLLPLGSAGPRASHLIGVMQFYR